MKILSKYNAELKLVLPLVLSLLGTVVVLQVLTEYSLGKYILAIPILTLGVAWSNKRYINAYNLFYTEENLILKNKKHQRDIDLLKINRIKSTLSDLRIMGFQFYEYKIDFTNEEGSSETIRFFVSNLNSSLWDFQDLIKKKSPNTVIENYASSWDE